MPKRATIYTYPWDLSDEGVERALDIIAGTAGLTSISLAQSYHVSTYLLPRNPRRPLYWGEEGALYFRPSAAFYRESPLEPLVSDVVSGPEYMHHLVDRIKARGLDFTSWLVFNYNHYLPQRYPEAAKHDPFGHINLAQLCPASPLTRGYALALCREIAAQFRPDEINIESLAYLHFNYGFRNPKVAVKLTPLCEVLMGLCYCPHCLQWAERAGLDDGAAFRAEVAGFLAAEFDREPDADMMAPPSGERLAALCSGRLQILLDARVEAATSLMQEAIDIAQENGARVSFFGGRDPITNGLDSERFLRDVYMVNGNVSGDAAELEQRIAALRGEFPAGTGLSAIVSPASFAGDAELAGHIAALADGGIDGFAFYNYGLLRRAHLEWIGACRAAWA